MSFEEYKKEAENLKDSAMFNLSLSSKELFHSNFLYWIWKVNPNAFQELIATLLGEESVENLKEKWGQNWVVSREYLNFDLCVKDKSDEDSENDSDAGNAKGSHQENNSKTQKSNIYLVLENKVKSIPYKSQLNKYVKKVNDHYGNKKENKNKANMVDYILLSLSDIYPNKNDFDINERRKDIEKDEYHRWKIVSYGNYIDAVKNIDIGRKEQDIKLREYYQSIKNDYCNFTETLCKIHSFWTDECYEKLGFNYKDKEKDVIHGEYKRYIDIAEDLRIHDLYHKSKYARICTELQKKFSDILKERKHDNYTLIDNDKNIINFYNPNNKEFDNNNKYYGVIFCGYNYLHHEPLIDVKIARRPENGNPLIIYVIQIQGGVYEHGIVIDHSKLEIQGAKAEKVWKYIQEKQNGGIYYIGKYPWMRYQDFTPDAKETRYSLYSPQDIMKDSGYIFSDEILYPNVKKRADSTPYYKYASNSSNEAMLYQFRKLNPEIATQELMEYLCEDVKNVIKNL